MAAHRKAAIAALHHDQELAAQAASIGVDPDALKPVREAAQAEEARIAAATRPRELDAASRRLAALAGKFDQLARAQQSENTKLAAAAQALITQRGGNLEAVRADGTAALTDARNEGTIAAFLKLDGFDGVVRRVDQYGALLAAGTMEQVSLGAAGTLKYRDELHNLLAGHMPARTIVISLQAQELWAYENGKVALDTPVTTGRDSLPTDIGPMSVLWKVSPWKMHSPWPAGSPHWYPDSMVRKVVWFTNSGEGMHDAPWRRLYGPGTNRGEGGTHGCVNMPGNTVDFVYDWAPEGTPVIVIPGDGAPVADQVLRDTIDTPAAAQTQHGS
jgi:hypothetical protein